MDWVKVECFGVTRLRFNVSRRDMLSFVGSDPCNSVRNYPVTWMCSDVYDNTRQ